MSEILFSVIVPVYNVEEYLQQCLDSIVKQNGCALELILVDDGSTDSSGRICDDYADRYGCVRVIHKENGGAADARNVGVNAAMGEYMLFVDSDDYLAADAIAEIEKVIFQHNRPDIVCLECVKIYNDGKKSVPMRDGVTAEINTKSGDELRTYIAGLPKYPASACSKAIKKDFFIQNKLFFKKGLLCEDLEWAARLFLSVGSAAYCAAPYYNYRQSRAGSASNSQNDKMAMDVLGIMESCRSLEMSQTSVAARYMLRSIMEYIFRFLSIHEFQFVRSERQLYKKEVCQYKYVLGTRSDRTSRLCSMFYRILGVEGTGWLLKRYLQMREMRANR